MIDVCVPTIPSRASMLNRALRSIDGQILRPNRVIVEVDRTRQGAAATRQRALDQVTAYWVSFLDDDDEMYPFHLDDLVAHAIDTKADLVYSWFDVVGGTDPFPQFFGRPWDDANPHQTTVTFVARTSVVRACGGFLNEPGVEETDPYGHRAGEEYRLVLRMVREGYRIVHYPRRTWRWHHHAGNTSGLPTRRR